MRRISVILLLNLICVILSNGQNKPPVAVDDTVFFHISSEPLPYDVTIFPLLNDYSEDMHPIEVFSCSGYPIVNDSAILIHNFWLQENDTIIYYIRDKINGLTSEPAYIYLVAEPRSFDMLDVNMINARINATSHHFSRYDYSGPSVIFECPKFSEVYSIADFDLIIGGLDETGRLRMAPASRPIHSYNKHYRAGPMSSPENVHYKQDWDRVWTIYRSEIENHQANYQNSGYVIPEAIQNWPGNGDTTLGQAWKLAPFIDQDHDEIYEPHEGDCPIIKGDQAIYFISCDDWGEHNTDSLFFGAEIHGMAYAYDCPVDSVFNYTMFIEYKIINRSIHNYHEAYVGILPWIGIGCLYDNYTACDTMLNAFYGYNLDNLDSLYWPCYGYSPPALGVTFLNQSLDHFMTFFYKWDWPLNRPTRPTKYYHNLRGNWGDGTPLTYGGYGYGGTQRCNYQVPGDPSDPNSWSMYSAQLDPMKLDYSLGSTGPFIMNSGDTISLELAILYARDHDGGNLSSVTLLKQRLKSLRAYYFNESIPCHHDVYIHDPIDDDDDDIHIYPNPASDWINISTKHNHVTFRILNLTGAAIVEGDAISSRINVEKLSSGLYLLELRTKDFITTRKFIKN